MKKFVPLFFTLLPAIFISCVTVSPRLTNPVTLDGQITSSEEWAETNAYKISLDRHGSGRYKRTFENAARMTVWFKNDDTWLYMLYKIAWPPSEIDSIDTAQIAKFTAPYGPPWAESDQGCVTFGGYTWDNYGWDDTQWDEDTDAGGQNDMEGAASYDGAFYWFEFRKRLNSGDGCDFTLLPGKTYKLNVAVWDNSLKVNYRHHLSLQLSE